MLQHDVKSNPVLQADIMALDALFKRIAERGRKIRSQNNITDGDNPARDELWAGQDPNSHGREKTKRVEPVKQTWGNQ